MTVMTMKDWNNILKRMSNLCTRVKEYEEGRGAIVSKTFVGFMETQLTELLQAVKKYS